MTVMLSERWWDLAACQNAEPELFFPISATAASAITVERAKRVCSACPVRSACLRYALDHRQEQGIWGGLTDEERQLARRRTDVSERRESAATSYHESGSRRQDARR
jgi:WhiB family redox-sensing transcriptional regulator